MASFLSELSLTLAADKLEAREYQINIAKSILRKGNTLVIMPTALGKTYVAIFVMAKIVGEILGGARERKKVLFLTPTKPLAFQQAKKISELVDFEGKKGEGKEIGKEAAQEALEVLSGENLLKIKPKKRKKEVEISKVMVMTGEMAPENRQALWKSEKVWCYAATPQTVEFDVLAGRMNLEDFCLVILDEAHRAVKEYSYSFVAREASKAGNLLIGLTASPSGKKEMIDEICINLQIQNIEIRGEADLDVRKYAHNIKMDWVFVDLPESLQKIKRQLLELLKEVLQELRSLGAMGSVELKAHKRELLEVRRRALQNLRSDPANYKVLSLQARAMNVSHAVDLIEIEGVHPLLQFMREMEGRHGQSKAIRGLLEDARWLRVQKECIDLVESGVEHPKFSKLREVVGKAAQHNERIIVFAHYRNTVAKIVEELGKVEGLKPVEFIGKSKGGMGQKEQQHVMQRFREGEFNVLVATSVAEEGLDIPEVGLVVFFEAVPSEIRLIQRRGRTGRIREGKVVVLITKGSKDEAMFWSSRSKERKMRQVVENMKTSGFMGVKEQDEVVLKGQNSLLDY